MARVPPEVCEVNHPTFGGYLGLGCALGGASTGLARARFPRPSLRATPSWENPMHRGNWGKVDVFPLGPFFLVNSRDPSVETGFRSDQTLGYSPKRLSLDTPCVDEATQSRRERTGCGPALGCWAYLQVDSRASPTCHRNRPSYRHSTALRVHPRSKYRAR